MNRKVCFFRSFFFRKRRIHYGAVQTIITCLLFANLFSPLTSLPVMASTRESGRSILDLTLPHTQLKGNQQPGQLFGQKTIDDKSESLQIAHAIKNREPLSLDLTQAIALALKHNSSIRTAYMRRITERYQYFLDRRNRQLWYYAKNGPSVSISGSRNITRYKNGGTEHEPGTEPIEGNGSSVSNSMSIEPKLGFTSPLGTSISISGSVTGTGDRTVSGNISITQPLLKGFGHSINAITWKQAEISEKSKILSLRSKVSDIIFQVIQQYRQLILANLTWQNNLMALKDAKKTFENNKIQVKAGRLASTELLSSQIQLETTKNELISSEDDIKQQQQSFATLLGLNKSIDFKLDDRIDIPAIHLDEKHLIDFALENKPDYLQSKLGYKSSQLDLEKAENDQLWDLSLTASAGKSETPSLKKQQNDYGIGLSLTIPLDRTEQHKALMNTKITVENNRIELTQKKLEIISSIHKQISTLEQGFKQLKIQEKRTDLQARQVKNTELSLKYGRSSAYDLAQQQQQLNANRNALISNKISYLNQLSSLDNYLGTALATWQVVLAP